MPAVDVDGDDRAGEDDDRRWPGLAWLAGAAESGQLNVSTVGAADASGQHDSYSLGCRRLRKLFNGGDGKGGGAGSCEGQIPCFGASLPRQPR
jgi:hypothetical protein